MSAIEKVYWDSCVWIAAINEEPARIDSARYLLERAASGTVEIWTSALTLAEVFKMKCGGVAKTTDAAGDARLDAFLSQSFITHVQVDHDIGLEARRLLRDPVLGLKKPNDAIHLASALWWNLDTLHTYDGTDLIGLSGKVATRSGAMITICPPPMRPPKALSPQGELLEYLKATVDETRAQ